MSSSNSAHHQSNPLDLPPDIQIPQSLQIGTVMLKVSAKKTIKTKVSLKYERGQIVWESKKGGSLNIESIREIRYGQDAAYYRTQFKLNQEYESSWLMIIYLSKHSTYKMLHLIALDPITFQSWKTTLEQILSFRHQLLGGLNHLRKRQTYWLKQNWGHADSSQDSKLDLQEVINLCRRLNISVPQSDIKAHFNVADSQRRGYLDFPAFQHFVRLIKTRTDLEVLFKELTSNRNTMSFAEFLNFMQKTQYSKLSSSTLFAIYNKFCDDPELDSQSSDAKSDSSTGKQMSIEGFSSFLQSSDNLALGEEHMSVCLDMNLPLCDYFISTSHNTYLVGNQLQGQSTVEGYIRALQQGCRSVELDCWDGESGEPVVYHGRTLTSKLLFSEALKAISKYAFIASPYPLILSLEVHCQPLQQERMAELLLAHFGETLVASPLSIGDFQSLPSPKDLLYRVLVKAKKQGIRTDQTGLGEINSDMDSNSNTSGSSTSSDSDLKRLISNASSVLGNRLKRLSSAKSPSTLLNEKVMSSASDQSPPLLPHSPTKAGPNPPCLPNSASRISKLLPIPLSRQLSDLAIYTVGVKARGFNKLTKYNPQDVVSLSERAINKFLKGGQLRILDLISHTRGHLTRAYPSATRVFSSNFLPHRFWSAGIQLVACNWQTYDLGMELNSAFFNLNGKSGYILKPLALRVKGKEKEAVIKMHKYELDIEIISVQQLPRLSIDDDDKEKTSDPHVEVQVFSPIPSNSSSSPLASAKRRTKAVKGNGFNAIYQESFKIEFEAPGEMLDICFLRLIVIDGRSGNSSSAKEEEGLAGKVCVSLGILQPGYRHLPLLDHLGQQWLFSSIFIKTFLKKQH
ncbi:hypothetical protein O181_045845 [Austropuccinia psidii MF-1]|uniref:Phosphoinositide phospholipase C n=1 Tax=Austropuccinia psidii MF-1 TaxID=1389203 RepID=A0A9Q3DMF1_9BASI|nr:hypothetical protein [Austropuccinia psidii MF-1]